MRFAGPLRPEFDDVVIPFAKRNQPDQLQQFAAAAECLGVEADALNQHIDPFVGRETLASRDVLVEIESGQLDGLQRFQQPGYAIFFRMLVLDVSDAPDAADQQLGMFLDRVRRDDDLLDAQVRERRLVHVVLVVQGDADLIDDLVPPFFADQRADKAGFVAMDIMLGQDAFDRLDATV